MMMLGAKVFLKLGNDNLEVGGPYLLINIFSFANIAELTCSHCKGERP